MVVEVEDAILEDDDDEEGLMVGSCGFEGIVGETKGSKGIVGSRAQ